MSSSVVGVPRNSRSVSREATGIEARFFPPFSALLATYLPALTFLLGTVLVHEVLGVDFGAISRDPAAELMTISHQQAESMALPLIGIQSNLGGLVWFMGAVSGLLALALLHRRGELWTPRGRFLAVMTMLSLVLGFDDVFMVHDGLGPQYLKLDEEPFILIYIVTALLVAVVFWRVILRLEPAMLALAVGGLAGSVLVDHFQEQLTGFSYRIFFEDGFKFLGIVGWAGFLTRQAWLVLTAEPATARPAVTGSTVTAPAPLAARPHRRHRAGTPAGRPVRGMAMILFGVLAVMGVIALSVALVPTGEVRVLITWGTALAAAALIVKGTRTLESRR